MRLAELLSSMIASGADLAAVSAVVEAARRQDAIKDQRRRELTAARVAKHRASRKAAGVQEEPTPAPTRDPEPEPAAEPKASHRNACNAGNARNALPLSPSLPLPPDPQPPPTPAPTRDPRLPSEVAPKGASGRGSALPADWKPKPRHFAAAAKFGRPEGWVHERAEAMREWAGANRNRQVARKADWDQAFDGWLRRDASAPKGIPARTLPLLVPIAGGGSPRIDFPGGYHATEGLIVRLIREGKRLPSEWGPQPGEEGCRVPQRLIDAAHRSEVA